MAMPIRARFALPTARNGSAPVYGCGQVKLIDQAYAQVDTPYIFHLEDDWEFHRPGFMEKSRAFLEADPKILLVWLRAWNDTSGHPLSHAAPDHSHGQTGIRLLRLLERLHVQARPAAAVGLPAAGRQL